MREQAGHSLKSALKHIINFDNRDSPVFSSRGTLFRMTQELAGLGGDVGFVKHEVNYQYNMPLTKDIVIVPILPLPYLMLLSVMSDIRLDLRSFKHRFTVDFSSGWTTKNWSTFATDFSWAVRTRSADSRIGASDLIPTVKHWARKPTGPVDCTCSPRYLSGRVAAESAIFCELICSLMPEILTISISVSAVPLKSRYKSMKIAGRFH